MPFASGESTEAVISTLKVLSLEGVCPETFFASSALMEQSAVEIVRHWSYRSRYRNGITKRFR